MNNKNNTYQKIIDAATESFQNLGYARTTTQLIASKAGVAEVTLFRHFGDKQKLFETVVQQIGGGIDFATLENKLNGDLETDLQLISENALNFFISQKDSIRMLMFEAVHFPEINVALAKNPGSMINLLEKYFQKQMDAGKITTISPKTTAQSFMSMIFGYAIGIYPVKQLLPSQVSIEEMKIEFVQIFLARLTASN